MKTKITKIACLFTLVNLTQYVHADASHNINMLVKFNTNLLNISKAWVGNNYNISCRGESDTAYPYGYTLTGSSLDSDGLEIRVNGKFDEDKRKICKIYDSTTNNTNKVYFTVESLPINFIYQGLQHTCYINQNIGTSYQYQLNDHHDKLQGEQSDTVLSCGSSSNDTYKINSGQLYPFYYDKGNITINIPESTPDIKMLVKFNVDMSSLSAVSLGNDYKMRCNGESSAEYPNGYNMINAILDNSGLEIGVNGPFDGDKRNSCKIYDNTTGNVNKVYFSVESLPIYFTYQGVKHSCYINQNIGTSYETIHHFGEYNKLQGEYSNITLPCNGLVNTDTYKITAGQVYPLYYDKGNITINMLP